MNTGERVPWSNGQPESSGSDTSTASLISRDLTDQYASNVIHERLPELQGEHIYENPIIISLLQSFHDVVIIEGLDKAKLWLDLELDHAFGPPRQP